MFSENEIDWTKAPEGATALCRHSEAVSPIWLRKDPETGDICNRFQDCMNPEAYLWVPHPDQAFMRPVYDRAIKRPEPQQPTAQHDEIDWDTAPEGATAFLLPPGATFGKWLITNRRTKKVFFWDDESEGWVMYRNKNEGLVDYDRAIKRPEQERRPAVPKLRDAPGNRRATDQINVVEGVDMNVPGYERLALVLQQAFDQAAKGKGRERHANDKPFDRQPMQTVSRLLQTDGGMAFQAIKKIQEARNLVSHEARVRELLGAIVYVAGMVVYEEDSENGVSR